MSTPSLTGITLIVLVAFVCGKHALTYNCTSPNGTVYITLNNDNGIQFIIVPSCNESSGVGNKYILSHCLESFMNGTRPGYLFHETGDISEVRLFTIDCNNRSDKNANVSNILRNITINTQPSQHNFDFNLIVSGGNKGYFLGQELQVTLKAAGPYNITPVKCIAYSSVNPNISIVLWENGTTQRQYLLTNFSDTCNNTLTATMYGFRFVHSTGVSLSCSVRPCPEIHADELSYTDDTDFLDQARYSEDDDYLGLIPEATIARTITLNIL